MNIRTKFLFIFLLTAILPLAILAFFILQSSQSALAGKVEDNLQTLASLKESQVRAAIASYNEQLTFLSKRARLSLLTDTYNKNGDPPTQEALNTYLTTVQLAPESERTMIVIGQTGQIIGSTDTSLVGQSRALGGDTVVFMQKQDQPLSVFLKAPIVVNDVIIGEIGFIETARDINAITKDYIGLGESGEVFFTKPTEEGFILNQGRFTRDQAKQQELHSQLFTPQLTEAIVTRSKATQYLGGDQPTLVVMRHLSDFNTTLIIKKNTAEAFQSAIQLRDSVIVFSLVFSLVVIMAILLLVHSITAPIANLISLAKKITAGDLNERALVLSKDEIGVLATALNRMLDDLQASKLTLEKKVHERTQQLEATNKELESFSYSVSHDLRAPLRAIDGFSKILAEDYAANIGDDGKRLLDTIINSTKQMGQLIDDLLAFSRLGRQDVKKQEVDMSALGHEVFDEVKALNTGRSLRLTIHELPQAQADASLLRQVWANLFSNAVKFTRNKSTGIIEVGAITHPGETTYYVKDNGAGFDMAFVDKLFGVFQRLHDQRDFEGTGVGLAIIKRIITRHGGRVWAEGKVGVGATIFFTLPKETKKTHKQRRHHE